MLYLYTLQSPHNFIYNNHIHPHLLKQYLVSIECIFQNTTGCLTRGIQNSNIEMEEMKSIHHGNILFLPDQALAYPLPWAGVEKYEVGEVLCGAYWMGESEHKVPVPSCTRTVAKKQLEKLLHEGYRLMSAFEMEFILEDMATGNLLQPC